MTEDSNRRTRVPFPRHEKNRHRCRCCRADLSQWVDRNQAGRLQASGTDRQSRSQACGASIDTPGGEAAASDDGEDRRFSLRTTRQPRRQGRCHRGKSRKGTAQENRHRPPEATAQRRPGLPQEEKDAKEKDARHFSLVRRVKMAAKRSLRTWRLGD